MNTFFFLRTRRSLLAAAFSVIVLMAGCGGDNPAGPSNPPAPTKGKLSGKLLQKENSLPVQGATIVLTPSGRNTTTLADGAFSFSELAPGSYSIAVDAGDYGNGVVSGFTVTAGKTTTANIDISFPIGTWSLTVRFGAITRNYTLDYYDDLTYEIRGSGTLQYGTWRVRNNVITMESTNSNDSWDGDYDPFLMTGTVLTNSGTATWTAIR